MQEFKTPKKHVVGEVLFAILLVPAILFLGVLAGAFSSIGALKCLPEMGFAVREIIAVVVGLLFSFLFCGLSFSVLRKRLRFTMKVDGDQVLWGKPPFCSKIGTAEVERIVVVQDTTSRHLEIWFGSDCWRCFFDDAANNCAELLHGLCKNAVYVDETGQEFLPDACHLNKLVPLKNLLAARWQQTAKIGILALVMLGIGIAILIPLVTKGIIVDLIEERAVKVLLFPVILVVALIWGAVVQFRKTIRLMRSLRPYMALKAGDMTHGHAVMEQDLERIWKREQA